MRTYVVAKLHGIHVTAKSVAYHGSIGIDRSLLAAVGIAPYEQVHVVNLNNGARWVTYALPLDEIGAFSLNGGGARLGELGDSCVVMAYAVSDGYEPAAVAHCGIDNRVTRTLHYEVPDAGA